MSNIVKTEAIVLRTMKYRETSKIVTLYTRGFGKVKAIAKGARRLTSKFGSSLEPMSYVFVVLYKKEHRDLQLISQCDAIGHFRRLNEALEKIGAGMSVIELVEKVSHDEEANERMFRLLVDSLGAIDAASYDPAKILFAFQVSLATILGFRPEFGRCAVCGTEPIVPAGTQIVFHVGRGGPLCPTHAGAEGLKVKIRDDSLSSLRRLATMPSMRDVSGIDVSEASRREIESLLAGFLRYHVEALPGLKAGRVMSHLLAHTQ